jgi:hypothetical protein
MRKTETGQVMHSLGKLLFLRAGLPRKSCYLLTINRLGDWSDFRQATGGGMISAIRAFHTQTYPQKMWITKTRAERVDPRKISGFFMPEGDA